jgi:hypothetical protein
MIIRFPWANGPWQWVDSFDDAPICPFTNPITKDVTGISGLSLEGRASLRTVASDTDGLTVEIIDADPSFLSGDVPYIALQAFPEIADALASFVRAVDQFIRSGEPADLKDRSPQIGAAYRNAVIALEKAGATVGHEEQLDFSFLDEDHS